MITNTSRRNLFKTAVGGFGSLFLVSKLTHASNICSYTPEQVEGPFYPIIDQFDKDNDLTYVKNKAKRAFGNPFILQGVVTDESCRPVEGAVVEIWQACASGKYDHPDDPNTALLDPNFQYWGRSKTEATGFYNFKTIRPGHYMATNDWVRPAHIHFKVFYKNEEVLTSQIYFNDDPYNSNDRILNSLPKAEQEKLMINFENTKSRLNFKESRVGVFNISIKRK